MVNPIRRQPLKMVAVLYHGQWQLWERHDLESAMKKIQANPVLNGMGAGLPDEIAEVTIGERYAVHMGPIGFVPIAEIEPFNSGVDGE